MMVRRLILILQEVHLVIVLVKIGQRKLVVHSLFIVMTQFQVQMHRSSDTFTIGML